MFNLRSSRPIIALVHTAVVIALDRPAASAQDHDPATELQSFRVAAEFEVNLFASEQDGVVKPIQMRFDPGGRLWVIGSTVYPQLQPGQIPDDKVLILEDTNRDGRCDRTTVFADGLMIPTGIELGDGGAYVGHGTELLFLKDTDGDGRSDERRVVLRGFGTGDNHQNINSFLFGPGGELWMSQGLHIRSRVETPWGISQVDQAGIWRFWPHRLKLEGFYGSANEPQNPWGFAFTDWGEPIVLAGNNSSPIYPVPGLTSTHRDLPPSLIWKTGRGRKVSGGDIVGTRHFPDAWQGALILGGYINNAVWAVKLADDGAGFSFEDLPPLITTTNKSFRPVDVKFGPDGALYLCDWYNPIIGHYQASFRHPDRDKAHGRIWRVTTRGRTLTEPPRLSSARINDLLEHLQSPDRWTRRFAKRELATRPKEQVISALNTWIARPELTDHDLMEALGVFQSHEAVAPEPLERLCRAASPGARAYAASVVGIWADRLSDPLALLGPLVADENPRVRLQAVVACTYVPSARALEMATIAADLPTDKFIDYALNQAVFALKPYWLESFKTGKLDLKNKPSRIGLLIRADATPDTLRAVRDLVRSPLTDRAARETYWRILIETGDGSDFSSILRLPDQELRARLLPALSTAARARNIRPSGDPAAELRPLLSSGDPPTRAGALAMVGVWKLDPFRPDVESAALDGHQDTRVRRAAIQTLASFAPDTDHPVLLRLAQDADPTVQSAAVAALGGISITNAARVAADILTRLEDEAAIREIFAAFLQRQGGPGALANALTARPPSKQAAELGLGLMNGGGRRDEQLAQLLTQAAGLAASDHRLSPGEVATLTSQVRSNGDARRGSELFRRPELGCLTCHAVNGQGGGLGPDLSALGTAQPIDFIIGAILDPQKEIKEGFMSISVVTQDGGEYQGYEVRETADELVLRDVLQNQEVRLRRDAIREKKQNGSVMPPGLADTLSRAEFRDLVRYLSELGRPR